MSTQPPNEPTEARESGDRSEDYSASRLTTPTSSTSSQRDAIQLFRDLDRQRALKRKVKGLQHHADKPTGTVYDTGRSRGRKSGSKKPVKKPSAVRVRIQSGSKSVPIHKPHRFKPGTVALREIRRYQKGVGLLLPKAPFARVVKEIMSEYSSNWSGFRIQASAMEALQEAAEAYIIQVFSKAQLAAIHGKRVTVMQRDFQLVRSMCDGFTMGVVKDR